MSNKNKPKMKTMDRRLMFLSTAKRASAFGVAVLLLTTLSSATSFNIERYYEEDFEDDDGEWTTYGHHNRWEHESGAWVARIHESASDPYHYPATRAVLVSPVMVLGDDAYAIVGLEAKVSRHDIRASIELVDAVTQERHLLWGIGGESNTVGSTQSGLHLDLPPTTSGTATVQFILESPEDAYDWRGGDKYFFLEEIFIDTGFSV